MDPFTLLSISGPVLQGAIGLAQMGAGAVKSSNLERPTMGVPKSVTAATETAKKAATTSSGAAEAYEKMFREQVGTIAGSFENSGADTSSLGSLNASLGKSMDLAQKIAVSEAEMKQKNIDDLIASLGVEGEWQQKAWDWNSKQPYENDAAAASALLGAGLENTFNSFDQIAGIGLTNIQKKDPFNGSVSSGLPKPTTNKNKNPWKPGTERFSSTGTNVDKKDFLNWDEVTLK